MTSGSTRSIFSLFPNRSSFVRTFAAGMAAAALIAGGSSVWAQAADPAAAPAQTAPAATDSGAPAAAPSAAAEEKSQDDLTLSSDKKGKKEKVVQSKDTRKALKKEKKDKVNQLAGIDAKLPDKTLYDKAEDAVKRGHYDVARLDLQTLLNTYPDSQYQMRAKLAIADSWYKEGGTAALTQAEQEYKDFITFFPNAPEAAEAQMRVGDIYFKQMDKPDRDYTKTKQAEQEYRLMLQQFPDSPLVPQAKQRLREVQETLANRETNVADFYASHSNFAASVARYQTVVDTYPLYSHLDEVLIGLGDMYAQQAKYVRALPLKEDAKARLEKIYDDQAVAAYRKVVLEHSAAPHVEDARDRLAAMNLPIPTPTPEQAAASAALENSRGQYSLSKRATLLFLHRADTVPAASAGEPSLDDPKPTLAGAVVQKATDQFNAAMNPNAAPHEGTPLPAGDAAPAGSGTGAAQPAAAAPLGFQEVPTGGSTAAAAPAVDSVQPSTSGSAGSGTSVGVEIVPSSGSPAPARPAGSAPPAFPGTQQSTPADGAAPAATGAPQTTPTAQPAPQTKVADPLAPVGPPNAAQLPPVQKPDAAPDAINEATPGQSTVAQTASDKGKKEKPGFYKDTESSSKHKKKKGLGKLKPF
jgi:outer membrane protein assembly factor BamD